MKKFIAIFSLFLFLSFNLNTICTFAQPKTFTQGIYNVRDANLLIGTSYNIRNTSTSSSLLVLIVASDQSVQEFIRLEPSSAKYTVKPLQYDYLIVVLGNGTAELS